MSQGPSTFGTMTTSSLSPTSPDDPRDVVQHPGAVQGIDSRPQARSAEIDCLGERMKPSRAASLASIGIASSRLPSTTSTCPTSSGTLARTFSRCGGTKWIIRSRRTGISRKGLGRANGERPIEIASELHGHSGRLSRSYCDAIRLEVRAVQSAMRRDLTPGRWCQRAQRR